MSYDSIVLARPTLEHFIPFSEASGTPTDHFGSLVLSGSGMPAVGAASITCDGELSCGFGASLPGAADFFTLTNTGGRAQLVNDLTADWTVMFVVEVASFGTENQILIPLSADGAASCYIYTDATGNIGLQNQGAFYGGPSGSLVAGTPAHVAVTVSALFGTISFLVDGEPVFSNVAGAGRFANNPPATLPGDVALYGFTGKLSKVQSYSSVLTNEVISADATDALCLNPGDARISQAYLDVLATNADTQARVSQTYFDALTVLKPTARVSQVYWEALVPNVVIPVDNITATDTAATMTDSPYLHVPVTYTIDETDTAATMSDSPGATPETYTNITIGFIDENGNPFPPLVEASFYALASSGGTPLAAAFLGEPSSVSVPLQIGVDYRIEFAGGEGPTTCAFVTITGEAQTVQVAPYVSPAENQTNYTLSMFFLYVRGWLPTAAAMAGSNAWKLFFALSVIHALLDDATRAIGASERLQAAAGAQVDAWAFDFFGNDLPRLPSESDFAYKLRIEARFQRAYGTITAIEEAIAGFFLENPTLTVPVTVFDRVTNPALSALYGLQPGQVAIILAYGFDSATGWFLGSGFLGYTTRLANSAGNGSSQDAPYPGLAAAVNSSKSGGIVPVYISSLT